MAYYIQVVVLGMLSHVGVRTEGVHNIVASGVIHLPVCGDIRLLEVSRQGFVGVVLEIGDYGAQQEIRGVVLLLAEEHGVVFDGVTAENLRKALVDQMFLALTH